MRIAVVVAVLLCVAFGLTASASANGRTAIIVHGWNPNGLGQERWDETYGTLRDHLASQGYDVHGPILPATGNEAGDSVTNALFLQQYISDNQLTDVVFIGHSLGAVTVEYYVRLLDTGEVGDYVTLDSNLHSGGAKGALCTQYPPDLCSRSSVLKSIFSAPARSDLFLLNVWAVHSGDMGHVDCSIRVGDTHQGMVSNPQTLAAIHDVMVNVNPCDDGGSGGGGGSGGPGTGGGNGGGGGPKPRG